MKEVFLSGKESSSLDLKGMAKEIVRQFEIEEQMEKMADSIDFTEVCAVDMPMLGMDGMEKIHGHFPEVHEMKVR